MSTYLLWQCFGWHFFGWMPLVGCLVGFNHLVGMKYWFMWLWFFKGCTTGHILVSLYLIYYFGLLFGHCII